MWPELKQSFPNVASLQQALSTRTDLKQLSWKSRFYRGELTSSSDAPAVAFKAVLLVNLALTIPHVIHRFLQRAMQENNVKDVSDVRVKLAVAHPNSRAGAELWCSMPLTSHAAAGPHTQPSNRCCCEL